MSAPGARSGLWRGRDFALDADAPARPRTRLERHYRFPDATSLPARHASATAADALDAQNAAAPLLLELCLDICICLESGLCVELRDNLPLGCLPTANSVDIDTSRLIKTLPSRQIIYCANDTFACDTSRYQYLYAAGARAEHHRRWRYCKCVAVCSSAAPIMTPSATIYHGPSYATVLSTTASSPAGTALPWASAPSFPLPTTTTVTPFPLPTTIVPFPTFPSSPFPFPLPFPTEFPLPTPTFPPAPSATLPPLPNPTNAPFPPSPSPPTFPATLTSSTAPTMATSTSSSPTASHSPNSKGTSTGAPPTAPSSAQTPSPAQPPALSPAQIIGIVLGLLALLGVIWGIILYLRATRERAHIVPKLALNRDSNSSSSANSSWLLSLRGMSQAGTFASSLYRRIERSGRRVGTGDGSREGYGSV